MKKISKVPLFFCLVLLTTGSLLTARIFFFSNKDGGHWVVIFCIFEALNLLYFAALIAINKKKAISSMFLMAHSICLVVILFLMQNFQFIFGRFFASGELNYFQLMVKNFVQNGFSIPFMYVLFLAFFLLLPEKK